MALAMPSLVPLITITEDSFCWAGISIFVPRVRHVEELNALLFIPDNDGQEVCPWEVCTPNVYTDQSLFIYFHGTKPAIPAT